MSIIITTICGKCMMIILYLFKITIQVEVKIDNSTVIIDDSFATAKDKFVENFTIEAEIFDTGSWYTGNGPVNLLATSMAHLKMIHSVDYVLGFVGYHLKGELQLPKLWTAEFVRCF